MAVVFSGRAGENSSALRPAGKDTGIEVLDAHRCCGVFCALAKRVVVVLLLRGSVVVRMVGSESPNGGLQALFGAEGRSRSGGGSPGFAS